jgi:hypothetical protein
LYRRGNSELLCEIFVFNEMGFRRNSTNQPGVAPRADAEKPFIQSIYADNVESLPFSLAFPNLIKRFASIAVFTLDTWPPLSRGLF